MNAVEGSLATLGDKQKARVLRAWRAYVDGMIGRDDLVEILANTILNGNHRAYLIGMAEARRVIEEALEDVEILPPTAMTTRHLNATRISQAITTILADEALDSLMQLQRLATASAATAATEGAEDVVKTSKRVRGWVRALDANACELCTWWWREGRVWDKTHPMPRHAGCVCQQKPIVKRTTNYQTTEQAAARKQERERSSQA